MTRKKLRVLFVYRVFDITKNNSVIDAQAASLEKEGIEIIKYPILEGGLLGYFRYINRIKKEAISNNIDLIHAHYSFSGFIAAVAMPKITICSLMGSDVFQDGRILRLVVKVFSNRIWQKTIVKSPQMKKVIQKSFLIPNGVDLSKFYLMEKSEAIKKVGFNSGKFNIIFVAENPKLKVKNYRLAEAAVKKLNDPKVVINIVSNKNQDELVYFYNAADLLLMTSLTEGSPNVIKEALACNCPIISTDVGDVKYLLKEVENCFIVDADPVKIAEHIKIMKDIKERSNGRLTIKKLDSSVISKTILDLYYSIVPYKKPGAKLRVMIVCSGTAENFNFDIHQAFISDQIKAIKEKYEIIYKVFLIKYKGIIGYIRSMVELSKDLKSSHYDLVHSHYGLSGLVSLFQKNIKKIITYHGTDVNEFNTRLLSLIVHKRSNHSIFVSEKLQNKLNADKKCSSVIPCGVNLNIFYPMDKSHSKKLLGLDNKIKYILFPSYFENRVKNYPLAKSAIDLINNSNVSILELKNRTRDEVNILLNASELLLMTSFSEGSSQILKEALAVNCPIVSTPVGDAEYNLSGVRNCFIVNYNPQNVADAINLILKNGERTNGREKVLHYDNRIVAEKVYGVYKQVLNL